MKLPDFGRIEKIVYVAGFGLALVSAAVLYTDAAVRQWQRQRALRKRYGL